MNDFERLFESFKRISLRPFERNSMREELRLYMTEHPARAPFITRVVNTFSLSRFQFSSFHLRPVAMALMLVLCVGVGTSYAAEGALPGNLLYPVKIHVNESVRGALAVGSEAKAQWNIARTARRLAEAETLAQQNNLTPAAQVDIESALDQTGADFDADVRALASATTSAPVIVAAATELEQTLHQQDIALAEVASTSSPQSRVAIDAIRTKVRDRAQSVQRVRSIADTFANLSSSANEHPTAVAAENARATATMSARVSNSISATSSSTTVQVEVTSDTGGSTHGENPLLPASTVFQAAIKHAQDQQERWRDDTSSNGGGATSSETVDTNLNL
jgi:hypothetical protein